MDYSLPEMSRRNLFLAALVAAGLLIGAGATYVGVNYGEVSGQQAANNLVSTLQTQTGQQFEVVNVREQAGVYRVDLRGSNDQLQTYHVTKNGRLASPQMTDLVQANLRATVQNRLASCMANRSVVMFGNISQRQTQQQIQILGGAQRVGPIYQDVGNQQALKQAQQLGIRQLPTLVYNGSTLTGVNDLSQIQQFTGCQVIQQQ